MKNFLLKKSTLLGILLSVLTIAVVVQGVFLVRISRQAADIIKPLETNVAKTDPPQKDLLDKDWFGQPDLTPLQDMRKEMARMENHIQKMFGHRFDFFGPNNFLNEQDLDQKSDSQINLKDDGNQFTLTMNVPGIDRDNINVTVKDGEEVTIVGSQKQTKNQSDKKNDSSLSEEENEQIENSLLLPQSVDSSKMKVSYKNGVVTAILPKTKTASS